MTDKLTTEQIIAKFETAFLPHKDRATLHDYGDKIDVTVQVEGSDPRLLTLKDSLVDRLHEEQDLDSVIRQMHREIRDRVTGQPLFP